MMRYLEYVITNIEPIRIANLFTCKAGETTTLNYIPGSTIRGLVIGELSRESNFENIRTILLSDHIRFLNAYPSIGNIEMIPSPKGFNEHKKQDGRIQNVVSAEISDDGMKRAAIGSFCIIEDRTIKYMEVRQEEVLNIDVNKKENGLFRSDLIQAGQTFKGYIAFDDDGASVSGRIKEILRKHNLRVGSKRSAGYGSIEFSEIKSIQNSRPYENYSDSRGRRTYLYLLSNTAMRDENGEICGLNLKELEKKMDVSDLEIENSATSVVRMSGVNRTWGTSTPEIPMYEAGSVFKLKYKGTLDNIEKLEHEGIGIRKNEGCGRILFLNNYPEIDSKEKIQSKDIIRKYVNDAQDDVRKVLKIAARGILEEKLERSMERYILEHPLDRGQSSRSQAGVILGMCKNLRYRPNEAKSELEEFIKHEKEKQFTNKNHYVNKHDKSDLLLFITNILETPLIELFELQNLENVCTIPFAELLSETQQITIKLNLIQNIIEYANREDKNE